MRVITAAELEKMTPAEREATFKDSVIRDLGDVPAERRDVIEAQRARILSRPTNSSRSSMSSPPAGTICPNRSPADPDTGS